MEAEGATVLWNTSMQQHNLRSRWMVSDGVSKGFNVVENTHNGFQFEKLDCVGHVQKQMEKHLIDLKVTTKGKLSDGKPIGGQGRLTEGQIKCLQKYYELAIRQKLILCQRQIPLRGKLMLLFTPWKKTLLLSFTAVCILQILPNNTTSVRLVSLQGVNGNKTLQQEHQSTIQMTVCLRHFLICCALPS